jgi:Ca-activated chloride channel homolog
MTFARGTTLRQDFTQNRQQLAEALGTINETSWGTGLFAAVEKAANKARTGTNKKRALIVISDGGDNSGRRLRRFQAKLRSAEVLMYPIEIQSASKGLLGLFEPPTARRTEIMHSIAQETGGRWFGLDAAL